MHGIVVSSNYVLGTQMRYDRTAVVPKSTAFPLPFSRQRTNIVIREPLAGSVTDRAQICMI